jgi:hypothetical protein
MRIVGVMNLMRGVWGKAVSLQTCLRQIVRTGVSRTTEL